LFKVEVMDRTSLQPTAASQNAADVKNATLSFAILGCVTGLAMGCAGGLAGRSPSWGVIVGLGAQAAGGFVGAIASLALLPLFFRGHVPDPNDLLSPILIHGVIWSAVGAIGGLAFAMGMRRGRDLPKAIAAACVGAVLASVLFHLLVAGLFPDSGAAEPLGSSSVVRLLAMLLVTFLIAVGATRGALGRVPHPTPSATA
jgi:hypothetical protein